MESKPDLFLVSFSQIDKDVRVLRHIQALKADFRIKTIGYGESPNGVAEHFKISPKYKYLPLSIAGLFWLLTRQYQRALNSTQSFRFARGILERESCDVLFLNDVQTIGLSSCVNLKTTLVMDMHEYAPLEMEDDWRFRILLQGYYTTLCSLYLPKADLLITVSEGLKTGFDALCNTSAQVVRNICGFEHLPPSVNMNEIRLVHSGLAAKARHLEVMIDAVSGLEGFSLDLYLVVAPRQQKYYNKLKKLAQLTSNVDIKLPVKPAEIAKTLNSYDIGLLVIPPSNFSLKHCLPNKLFDYVQARLMTVCGPSPDLSTAVNAYEIGMVIDGYSALDLRKFLSEIERSDIQKYKLNADKAASVLRQEIEGEHLASLVRDHYFRKIGKTIQ